MILKVGRWNKINKRDDGTRGHIILCFWQSGVGGTESEMAKKYQIESPGPPGSLLCQGEVYNSIDDAKKNKSFYGQLIQYEVTEAL